MPVVLMTVGGKARSGHSYDDRTGISYEYPDGRYEKWIQTGERFVYQRPGIGYTACGVVGEITNSETPGRLICEVLMETAFDSPVPLKDETGGYYEADPTFWKDKVYWGQGVRPLTDDRFEAILRSASVKAKTPGQSSRRPGYPTPDQALAVDAYAMTVAMDTLAKSYPRHQVVRMPHNNPGFDVRVGETDSPRRFVEVKGTQASRPIFFLSEGERRFSTRESSRYTLLVVTGIDLAAATHGTIAFSNGAIGNEAVALEPVQWRGHLLKPDPNWRG